MIQQKNPLQRLHQFMTSDSKDSHEGHVALEGCRHENLELVYHIQVALILECTPEPAEQQSKEIVLFDH